MSTNEKLMYVKVSDVHPNPFQPRRDFDEKSLTELAESIDTQGLIQPIIVREVTIDDEKKYELIAGERRLRAVRDILGMDRIKAIIQTMTDIQSEEAALVENIQREDLNVIEETRAIVALMNKEGLTQEQVAKRLGKSRSDVSNLTRLMKLCEPVQEMLANGKLLRTIGFRLSSIDDPNDQIAWANKAVQHGWNYEQFRKALEKSGEHRTKRRRKNLVTVPAEEQTKNLALVEFDDNEALHEFIAYMIEQGYKCVYGVEILNTLNNRLTPTPAVPETEPDIFSGLDDECAETAEVEVD